MTVQVFSRDNLLDYVTEIPNVSYVSLTVHDNVICYQVTTFNGYKFWYSTRHYFITGDYNG